MSPEKKYTRKLISEVKAAAIGWKRIIWLMVETRDVKVKASPQERDALLRIQRNLTADLMEIGKCINGGLGNPREALTEADLCQMRCDLEMKNPAVATTRTRVSNKSPIRAKRPR